MRHTAIACVSIGALLLMPSSAPAQGTRLDSALDSLGRTDDASTAGAAATGDTYSGRGLNPDPGWAEIPSDAPDVYLVVQGDTLWDICGRVLRNPWFWAKIAEINPQLKSPHWIYPGEQVRLRPGADIVAAETRNTSNIADTGWALGGANTNPDEWTVADDQYGSGDVGSVDRSSNEMRSMLAEIRSRAKKYMDVRQEGMILDLDTPAVGMVANSPLNKVLLTEGDIVYLDLKEPDRYSPGDVLQVYHQVREVKHPVSGDSVGMKIQIMANVRISKKRPEDLDTLAVPAVLENAYGEVERGDLLRPVEELNKEIHIRRNLAQVDGFILDRMAEVNMVRQSMLVYLDKGLDDGVEAGNTAYIYQRGDGVTNGMTGRIIQDHFEPSELPRFEVGKLLILRSSSKTSLAVLLSALTEIHVGDPFVIVPGGAGPSE